MIRFFRHLRQGLLAENRLGKYLLYAMGEIVLVVIGILIALQINNWNENRKLRITQEKTLKELRSDLAQSLLDVESDMGYFKTCLASNQALLKAIQNELPFADSLSKHFANMYPAYATFSINQSTFDHLRQNGENLIPNDSLRTQISAFYTSQVNLYREAEARFLIEHYENAVQPMLLSAFTTTENDLRVPLDYTAFCRNSEYREVIRYNLTVLRGITGVQRGMLKQLQGLIGQIDGLLGQYK